MNSSKVFAAIARENVKKKLIEFFMRIQQLSVCMFISMNAIILILFYFHILFLFTTAIDILLLSVSNKLLAIVLYATCLFEFIQVVFRSG